MDRYAKQRKKMVDAQIRSRGVRDERVLRAMEKIPRHLFIDEGLIDQAYNDNPLPIGEKQTISQPYIVALMTEALEITDRDKVLSSVPDRATRRPSWRSWRPVSPLSDRLSGPEGKKIA
jgi:protein-L-isoaspartate(D-aspartate) O-methyltransferase